MQYANLAREVYFIVIDENKKDFIDVLKDLDYYDEYASPLENFSVNMMEYYRENDVFGKMGSMKNAKFFAGDSPAEMFFGESVFSFDLEPTVYTYMFISFVSGKDSFYQIMAWTLKDGKERYREDLESICLSFREF